MGITEPITGMDLPGLEIVTEEPILREILLRKDCPLKFVAAFKNGCVYGYNSLMENAERDAYINPMLSIDLCPLLEKRLQDELPEFGNIPDRWSDYVGGKQYSYPDEAIEAYITSNKQDNKQKFVEVKKFGDAFLKLYRAKSIPELQSILNDLLSKAGLPPFETYPPK